MTPLHNPVVPEMAMHLHLNRIHLIVNKHTCILLASVKKAGAKHEARVA